MSSAGPEGQAIDLNYRRLGAQDVAAWRAQMLEGTRDFPLGFLQSAAEVQALSVERCREIPGNGALRGVFRQDALLGLCGYRPQMFARMAHRVEPGAFFVARKAQGTGVADRMMQGRSPRRAAWGAAWSSFTWMRRTTAPLPFTSGTGSGCWRACPIACASTVARGSICSIGWSWTLEAAHEKADL